MGQLRHARDAARAEVLRLRPQLNKLLPSLTSAKAKLHELRTNGNNNSNTKAKPVAQCVDLNGTPMEELASDVAIKDVATLLDSYDVVIGGGDPGLVVDLTQVFLTLQQCVDAVARYNYYWGLDPAIKTPPQGPPIDVKATEVRSKAAASFTHQNLAAQVRERRLALGTAHLFAFHKKKKIISIEIIFLKK